MKKLIIEIDDKVYDELLAKELDGMLTCKQVECMNVAIYNGKPLQEELEEIKAEICKKHKIDCDLKCRECIYYPCLDSGASYIADIKILDKHIKKLKGENNE